MIEVVKVFYNSEIVGKLAIKNKKIYFEYDRHFLTLKLELSPFKLPLKANVIESTDLVFDSLFGVFNDSLPDGWGRLLVDRYLRKCNMTNISPLDRLSCIGPNGGIGALTYEPILENPLKYKVKNLDNIFKKTKTIDEYDDQFLDELRVLNGSSCGARPKILTSKYLIKFPSSFDPVDIGAIEYAYNIMAKKAGLDVPKVKLFPSKLGPGYFGSKRFDIVDNTKIHTHTLSGLIHADHRIPCLDYQDILKVTGLLTKDKVECEKLIRLTIFNILSHNRDDHAKNFSYCMQKNGEWKLSPTYDITFSYGPNGEHCTTICGEGRNPTVKHIHELVRTSYLNGINVNIIIEQVKDALSEWKTIAKKVGVSKKSLTLIKKNLLFS